MKLSLHKSGRWHVGFHAEKKDVLFSPETAPPSRFQGVWDRSGVSAAPWVLAARVCFPWTSPSKPPREAAVGTRLLECAGKGEILEVAIFLVNVRVARDDSPGKSAMGPDLVGRIPLDRGCEVVIVSRTAEMWQESLLKSGTPSYFRGKSKSDLLEANRIVVCGESSDGSTTFIETILAGEHADAA